MNIIGKEFNKRQIELLLDYILLPLKKSSTNI